MKRIKLTVAYDGTNYCGWQIQDNGITIEEVLNRELSKLLQEDIKIMAQAGQIPGCMRLEMWQSLIRRHGFRRRRSASR